MTYSARILFEPTISGLKAMKNHVERASLELSSEGICDIIAFCCTEGSMIGRLFPEEAFNLGMKVTDARSDAIFISCTNFRAIEIIQRLEDSTGKFVVSSNQATMWHAMRKLGIQDPKKGYGRLFDIT